MRALVKSLFSFVGNLSENLCPVARRCIHRHSVKKHFTVCIEGNIGSGKTTLLQHLAAIPNTQVLMEPVSKWRDIQGHNALALMYSDPRRWSMTLQTYVQLTMLQQHTMQHTASCKMMERSIYSAKYCFVENLHRSGQMADVDHVVLTQWFDWILDNHKVDVDLIVYLQTSPETVYERISKRCRKEETTIPLTYLQTLHDLYEDWLICGKFKQPAPVLVLDGNVELYDRKYNDYIDTIMNYLYSHMCDESVDDMRMQLV